MYDTYYDYPQARTEDVSTWLTAFISHLKKYDQCLKDLSTFTRSGLRAMHQVMNEPIDWGNKTGLDFFGDELSLCQLDKLKDTLHHMDYNLGLDVRKRNNFPVYFLFRYKSDTYLHHFVVLEALYRSPEYPIHDQRFIRLKPGWYEKMFLNAAPYRPAIQSLTKKGKKSRNYQRKINRRLNQVARILNLAWDEDFELTRRVCRHLKIAHVVEAMEVTNLILCTEDFSWLRNQADHVLPFFEKGYDHPHIAQLLSQTKSMEAKDWQHRVDQAKEDYVHLKMQIWRFFKTEVRTENDHKKMTLWKMAFAYFGKDMPILIADEVLEKVKGILENLPCGVVN